MLEAKYQVQAVELRKLKDGRYGRNLWFFALKFYLSTSLYFRLKRLKKEFKTGRISLIQYDSYSNIIKMAI